MAFISRVLVDARALGREVGMEGRSERARTGGREGGRGGWMDGERKDKRDGDLINREESERVLEF